MRVAVVIPARDEERSLPLVLRDLPAGLVERVVVVDNGSRDATGRVALEGGAEVMSEPRRGYGSACLAGIAHLAPAPPEVVVFVDADWSDHPQEMPLLLAPLERGTADLVVGSRVLGHAEPGALLPQARLGNALAAWMIRRLYGHPATDLGPFRAIRWEALAALALDDRDFGWTAQMQARAIARGMRVIEVPVSYRRRVGVSKITGTLSGTLRAGWKIVTTILRERPR